MSIHPEDEDDDKKLEEKKKIGVKLPQPQQTVKHTANYLREKMWALLILR